MILIKKVAVIQLFAASVVCSLAPFAFAGSAGSTIFNFLKINPSPISAATGASNTFMTSQSIYVNPAILPWIGRRELSVEQLAYLSGANYSLINYCQPIDDFRALGASVGYLGVGGFTKTITDTSRDGYSEHGSFQYYDVLAGISYGDRVNTSFSYGLSLNTVKESIDGNTSSGMMFSAGGYFNPKKANYTCGFGVFNVGPRVKDFDLPSGAYIGFSSLMSRSLIWTTEGMTYNDGITNLFTGFQYSIKNHFFLRGGYKYPLKDDQLGDHSTVNFSGGIGFNVKSLDFDYAWVPYGDLGNTHRVSVTVGFEGKAARKSYRR